VQLNCSVLGLPKKGSTAEQCADAADCSPEHGIAAVSDGAGSAFESRRWARLLTQAFVAEPLLTLVPAEVLDWVEQVSAKWSASMSGSNLTVFEEMKIASEGSAATLVGVCFDEPVPGAGEGTWICMALGDSCLFQISEGELVAAMPLNESEQFTQSPPLFYTQREFTERDITSLYLAEGDWHIGDSFLLMTDAIAAWFLGKFEGGGKPWDTLAELDADSFAAFVADLRRTKQLRNDDVVILRLDPVTAPITGPSPRQTEPKGHRKPRSGGRPLVPVGGPAPSGPTRPPSGQTRSPSGPSHPPSGPARSPRGPASGPVKPPSDLNHAAGGPNRPAPDLARPPSGPARSPTGTASGPTHPPGLADQPGDTGPGRPPPDRRSARLRAAALVRTRRAFVVALALGLAAGVAVGWVARGSSAPSPNPVTTLSPAPTPSPIATPSPSTTLGGPPSAVEEAQAAARRFVLAMVNFKGEVSQYESSLSGLSTPSLAESLPKLLGLGSLTSGSIDSKGRVISSMVDSSTGSTAVVYLIVAQEVATSPAFHGHLQTLLIRMEMTLSGTNWQTSQIVFVSSASQMLPQAPSDITSSPPPSVSPTQHGT